MAGVVASVLLMAPNGFSQPVQGGTSVGQGKAQPQETSQEGAELRVKKAAQAISAQLEDTEASDAKSLAELVRGLSDETLRSEAPTAVKQLLDEKKIKRTGSGTEQDPYLYYESRGATG